MKLGFLAGFLALSTPLPAAEKNSDPESSGGSSDGSSGTKNDLRRTRRDAGRESSSLRLPKWELVDVSRLRVSLKAEFPCGNREIYRPSFARSFSAVVLFPVESRRLSG